MKIHKISFINVCLLIFCSSFHFVKQIWHTEACHFWLYCTIMLAMLFLEVCLKDSPKTRLAAQLESLPASAAQGRTLDLDSLSPCAWALPAVWLQPRMPDQAGCRMRGHSDGKWSGELCICESRLLGNCSKAAVLLSQGAVVVVQLGPGSLVKNIVNLTLGCRQGRRRQEETRMRGRTQKEEWELTLQHDAPNHCGGTTEVVGPLEEGKPSWEHSGKVSWKDPILFCLHGFQCFWWLTNTQRPYIQLQEMDYLLCSPLGHSAGWSPWCAKGGREPPGSSSYSHNKATNEPSYVWDQYLHSWNKTELNRCNLKTN